MNTMEFQGELANLLSEYNQNKTLAKQLNYLNQQIKENEQQLNDSCIKIPFTRYKLLDKLGIIRRSIPTLLAQNKRLVMTYNAKVDKVQKTNTKLVQHLEKIISDCENSPQEQQAVKYQLLNKCFLDKI